MNTVPASEVKRRGVSAFDDALKSGPVHIIKNNRPRYVVLSEEEYRALTRQTAAPAGLPPAPNKPVPEAVDAAPGCAVRLGVAEGRYSIPEPDADEDAAIAGWFGAAGIFPPGEGNP